MAGHELDAERLGLDRDPQHLAVRGESPELTTVHRTAVVWLALILAVVALWTFLRTRSGPPPSSPASSALALKAEPSDGRLVLTWNREADAVRNAQQATLTITDGDHAEDVPLDAGQLQGGSVVYEPLTSDVSFRMEFVIRGGESRSESVRVMFGRRR